MIPLLVWPVRRVGRQRPPAGQRVDQVRSEHGKLPTAKLGVKTAGQHHCPVPLDQANRQPPRPQHLLYGDLTVAARLQMGGDHPKLLVGAQTEDDRQRGRAGRRNETGSLCTDLIGMRVKTASPTVSSAAGANRYGILRSSATSSITSRPPLVIRPRSTSLSTTMSGCCARMAQPMPCPSARCR
jgi:hypothetical protein